MGQRPNVLLQIRFRDDEENTYFTKLGRLHGVEVEQFENWRDNEDRPSYDIDVSGNSFTFGYYDGSQYPEFGIAEDEHGPQTIGYDYLTSDWTEVSSAATTLKRIEEARVWAQTVVDEIGGEFTIAIGANFF